MTDETGLAAALRLGFRQRLSRAGNPGEATRWWADDLADLGADTAARHIDARLADPATVEAVARALVLATEDDCDGYIPLTDLEVGTFAVTRREEAQAALAVVRGLLGGTGGEGA